MKAIRVRSFGAPEVMRLEEVPDPTPGPGRVLVRLHAAGVNPVDCYLRSGSYPGAPPTPYTPGSDGAGVVERVGAGVGRVVAGDRVYVAASLSGAGTYSELTVCEEQEVFPLPESLSFAQGAAVGVPYATAYRAIFQRAQAVPGEAVLVHGASGGVGLAALQLLKAAGLMGLGTVGSPEGRALALSQGASGVFDHRQPGYLEEAVKARGRGFDVILEMLANVNLGRDLKALAPGGRVVVIGSRGDVQITPRDLMGLDASILGMRLPNASAAERASIHAALGAGLANGTLHPVIAREIPLAEAPRAHHDVMEQKALGKIVLVP